ncbi:MAG: TetR/AcrR family transcriptional regulator [Leptospiraceae bacterium]|nr:TetR/AcrR family transcriptional regulator [Leptospiraceae bacterium]
MSGKDNILIIASELFYKNGYANTGIVEILENCNLTKPSLYHHFGSKAGLGFAYLEMMREELFNRLHLWIKKRKSLNDYLQKWVLYIRKGIKEKKFHGCPFASFSYQLSEADNKIFAPKLEEISRQWLQLLTGFITQLQSQGKVSSKVNPREVALDMLSIYQGNVALWRLTHNIQHIDTMERQFKQLAKNVEIP